jgi:putative phosphotransacetylase
VRESGDLAGSPGVTLTGPEGEVTTNEGAIIAKRHLHLTPEDAAKFGLKDKQIINVRVEGERALIFDEVVARVSPEYATFMHVDYDEINAASLFGAEVYGTIVD